MPVLETKGALSAQGYGLTTSQPQPVYIEDLFSTWLYTGNGSAQAIGNGIQLGAGATSPSWISSMLGNVAGNPRIQSSAADISNNVYAVGNILAPDSFFVKYNANGVIQFQKRLTLTSLRLSVVRTDSSGNIFIAGDYLDGSSYTRVILIKYLSDGTYSWARSLGYNDRSTGRPHLAIDGSGNPVLTYASSASPYLSRLAKFNTSGTLQWIREYDTSIPVGITADASDFIYVASETTTQTRVFKVNSSGIFQWGKVFSDPSGNNTAILGGGIAVDSLSNVYVGVAMPSDFNTAGPTLFKFNSVGSPIWSHALQEPGSIRFIAVDGSDNIYYSLDSSNAGVPVLSYTSSGTLRWRRTFQSQVPITTGSVSFSLTASISDNIYVCGLLNNNSSDQVSFVSKIPSNGDGTGAYSPVSYIPQTNVTGSSVSQNSVSVSLTTVSETANTIVVTENTTSQTFILSNIPTGPGKGGLVWMKGRSGATDHALYDTVRGATFDLASNLNTGQTTRSTGLTGFLANGFNIGSLAKINTNAETYVSWTFREQPRFFDIVTYTGNGANRTIAHNLQSVPGCIMVKRLDTTGDWQVYHRSLANTQYLVLNSTAAAATGATRWNSTTPTATEFSLGTDATVNANGGTYVAYLFAHNAGGFGATGADNVISCGSFTTDSNGNATVNLGYEPQWVLMKLTATTGNWLLFDNMRGMTTNSTPYLLAESTAAETANSTIAVQPTATGFDIRFGNTSSTPIYIAIRRGPMRTPTVGTSVFGLNARTGTGANATVTGGQTDDAILIKNRGSAVGDLFAARLTGTGYLETSSTAAEVAAGTTILQANPWDVMDGVKLGTTSTITNASGNTFINYLFRRAPGFFDVVCYTGTGQNTRNLSHNLGVAPEFIVVKRRNTSGGWPCSHSVIEGVGLLNASSAISTSGASGFPAFNGYPYAPLSTSSAFYLGNGNGGVSNVNADGGTYVAYLFASCPGVSKVGSYTGTGATQTINCGFSAGARFALIKRTDSTGDWYVWDSARGIVAGNDPYLRLNSTAAEVTNTDWVDTAASGFELSNAGGNLVNVNGASYIFLSIA